MDVARLPDGMAQGRLRNRLEAQGEISEDFLDSDASLVQSQDQRLLFPDIAAGMGVRALRFLCRVDGLEPCQEPHRCRSSLGLRPRAVAWPRACRLGGTVRVVV